MISPEQFRAIRDKDLSDFSDEKIEALLRWIVGHEHRGVGREYDTEKDLMDYYDLWHVWSEIQRYVDLDPALLEDSNFVTRNALKELPYPDDHIYKNEGPFGADYVTAEDYTFINACPVPKRQKPKNILDFGSGMGRAVNIWSRRVEDLVFCSLDAIELSYLAQNYYYNHVPGMELFEYFEDPESFKIDQIPGIYHLPSWRLDLLPENHFDLITANMVLNEISELLLNNIYDVLPKILKPGGALYIRDHGIDTHYEHEFKEEEKLKELGFTLEMVPYIHGRIDMNGSPRIWRKIGDFRPFYRSSF